MAPLILPPRRTAGSHPPTVGAPGPLEVALSLVVYRVFPFRGKAIGICLSWLNLRPAPGGCGTAAVAARHQVSRSYVATLLRCLRAAAAASPPPPALTGALQLLQAGAPTWTAGQAAAALAGAGLAGGVIHPITVLRAAGLFGLEPGLVLRPGGSGTVVVGQPYVARYDTAPAMVRRAARGRGLVRIHRLDVGLPDAGLRAAVGGQPDIVVFGDWCWLSPDVSQVARVLGRLLTVAGPLPVGEVMAVLHRATRHDEARTAGIPDAVLGAYLRSQAAYRLDADRVGLLRPAPALLNRTDRALVAAFRAAGTDRLPTGELVRALNAHGQSTGTAQAMLSISPLLRQVRLGVQALRGGGPTRPLPSAALSGRC